MYRELEALLKNLGPERAAIRQMRLKTRNPMHSTGDRTISLLCVTLLIEEFQMGSHRIHACLVVPWWRLGMAESNLTKAEKGAEGGDRSRVRERSRQSGSVMQSLEQGTYKLHFTIARIIPSVRRSDLGEVRARSCTS